MKLFASYPILAAFAASCPEQNRGARNLLAKLLPKSIDTFGGAATSVASTNPK